MLVFIQQFESICVCRLYGLSRFQIEIILAAYSNDMILFIVKCLSFKVFSINFQTKYGTKLINVFVLDVQLMKYFNLENVCISWIEIFENENASNEWKTKRKNTAGQGLTVEMSN